MISCGIESLDCIQKGGSCGSEAEARVWISVDHARTNEVAGLGRSRTMMEWRIGDQSARRDGTAADLEVVGPLGGGNALPGTGCDLVKF